MATKKSLLQDVSQLTVTSDVGFPVPFTEQEFRRDVLVLYVHQMRTMAWMTGINSNKESNIWLILGKAPEHKDDIYAPDVTVEDLGLTHGDIRETSFAMCLENMYQYAYFGILDESFDPMEYGTNYTMLSAILCDMNRSLFMMEWESFVGGEESACAQRCLAVAELANARRVLEGHENFSFFFGANSKEDDRVGNGALTIRQMALLAGMEEMSIRAAANPKRAVPLPTYSDDGRTRVAIDAAKAWLNAKGRYLPITRRWNTGDIDLAKRKFSNFTDLYRVIHDRRAFLESNKQSGEKMTDSLTELATKYGFTQLDALSFSNINFVGELAQILEFPVDLFALRVRETLAKDELAAVERELRELENTSRLN